VNTTGHAKSRGRILLVEDDPDAALFALHVLAKRGGFDVAHTADPAVALVMAAAEPWDLVLTEAELPGMTGLELIDALRRETPALPIAVLTSHTGTGKTADALRSRADEFLEKPVRIDLLIATAAALISRGRAAPDNP
jgi:DNA-binding response OmpR family regulator